MSDELDVFAGATKPAKPQNPASNGDGVTASAASSGPAPSNGGGSSNGGGYGGGGKKRFRD